MTIEVIFLAVKTSSKYMFETISLCYVYSLFPPYKDRNDAAEFFLFLPEITGYYVSFDIVITWGFYVDMTRINTITIFSFVLNNLFKNFRHKYS